MKREKERVGWVLFQQIRTKWNFPRASSLIFPSKSGSINSSAPNSLLRIMVSMSMSACSPLNSLNWCRLELVTVECGGVRPLRRPLAARWVSAHYVSQAGIALSTAAPSGPTPDRTLDRFLRFSTDFHRPTQMWSYDWRYGKSTFHYFSLENCFSTQNMTFSLLVWELLINWIKHLLMNNLYFSNFMGGFHDPFDSQKCKKLQPPFKGNCLFLLENNFIWSGQKDWSRKLLKKGVSSKQSKSRNGSFRTHLPCFGVFGKTVF